MLEELLVPQEAPSFPIKGFFQERLPRRERRVSSDVETEGQLTSDLRLEKVEGLVTAEVSAWHLPS